MPAVLAIGDAVNLAVLDADISRLMENSVYWIKTYLLQLHYLTYGLLLDWNQLLGRGRLVSNRVPLLDELIGSEQRADMLSPKWRSAGRRHFGRVIRALG